MHLSGKAFSIKVYRTVFFVNVVYSCVLMSQSSHTQENTQEGPSASKGSSISRPRVKSKHTCRDSISPLTAGNHENNGQFPWADIL